MLTLRPAVYTRPLERDTLYASADLYDSYVRLHSLASGVAGDICLTRQTDAAHTDIQNTNARACLERDQLTTHHPM
jgi:hypothetical protein